MNKLISLLAGIIFGTGLVVSEMINPKKVLSFLDVFGNWDPSLAFVMIGALIVSSPMFHLIKNNKKPLFTDSFNYSKNKGVTRAIFSILKNKELTKIIQLFNAVDEWYIAELKNTRALKIDQLENILRKTYPQKKINVFKNIKNAYTSALSNSKENDNIFYRKIEKF